MASLTNLSIRRPVATTMAYLILIVVGIVSFRTLPVDLLPQVEFTQLTVRVRYPNASPREIEQLITDPIENAVSGLPNLERISSTSQEGSCRVRLDFGRGTNIDEAANDLRAALETLRDELPLEADPPQVFKLDLDRVEVVNLVATSTLDLETLTRVLEDDVARRFEQIPGVGAIDMRGAIHREIHVDLDRERMRAAGLTALDVRDAISRDTATLAGGIVKGGFADLPVRPLAEFQSVGEVAETVIASPGGLPLRVRDVARVSDGFEEVSYLAEINGVPSVSIGIQKQSGANTVEVADGVLEEVERFNSERDDIHLTVARDTSEFIRESIANVRDSAIWGALLAVGVLYLFIRSRSGTAIIAAAIPISVISTFGLLFMGGLTLNQMTFGGLALGVGMIVDNAIVVLDAIVRKREEEQDAPEEAASHGTRDVAGAVVASTLTTCIVFLPVVFARTTSGALFQALALVVVFSLACSLLVALTLVPMLASRYLRVRAEAGRGQPPRGVVARIEAGYVAWLRMLLRRRGVVLAVTGALLTVAILLWPLIPVELAPMTDADEIDIDVEMGPGTNIAVVRAYVEEVEDRVRNVVAPDEVRFVSTEVRGGDAEVELALVPQERRERSSTELADELRRALEGTVPGAEISVDAQPGLWILRRVFSSGSGEDALEIELRGWDLARSERIAAEVRRRLEGVRGLTDVRVRRELARPEERLILERARIAELGLTVEEVTRTIQINVGGLEAARFREAGREYPIIVRLQPEDRLTGADLANVSLRTPDGAIVPLQAVVERERASGPTEIQRVDGQRVTYISAGLESGVALGDAVERAREALAGLELPAGFALLFGGEYQEQLAARRDFIIAIVMALVLVYMVMAAQFERFLDPLIVMLSVPVALIGVVPALLLTGTTLNIQSVMGLVMLIGIVVNNAIVLIDAVNLLRRERGFAAEAAVLEAARLRLRPILMTTLTTILGLMPLALGIGTGAEIQAALARVVVGGLTASTLVTLVLIPVTYMTIATWQSAESTEKVLSRQPRARPRPATTLHEA